MMGDHWLYIGKNMGSPMKIPCNTNVGKKSGSALAKSWPANVKLSKSMAVHGQQHGLANEKPIKWQINGYTWAITWARQ